MANFVNSGSYINIHTSDNSLQIGMKTNSGIRSFQVSDLDEYTKQQVESNTRRIEALEDTTNHLTSLNLVTFKEIQND